MSNIKSTPENKLLTELEQLCQEKQSGTLFLTEANRRAAQISLLEGSIVGLSYLNKRGLEALEFIQQLNPDWLQFMKGSQVKTDPHLPPTSDIIRALNRNSEPPSSSTELINAHQVEPILKAILAEFMGPVAQMICNKVLRQDLSLELAINLLAQEIPDQDQSLQFKERVRQKLP